MASKVIVCHSLVPRSLPTNDLSPCTPSITVLFAMAPRISKKWRPRVVAGYSDAVTDGRPESPPPLRRQWARETAIRSVAAFPWEQTLIMGVAAVIGVYAGIAAGLFSN